MKKATTILSILLCNCCLCAQLPNLLPPIPQPQFPASGSNINFGKTESPVSTMQNPLQYFLHPVSAPQETLLENEAATRVIDEAAAYYNEFEQRINTAASLIFEGFPSHKGERGTENYFRAYEEINAMLTDSIPLSIERAIFLIENAFLENAMKYEYFQKAINERVQYCEWRMKELKLNPQDELAKNMAIFSLLTDTIKIKQPGTEKTITHYPLKYNLNDYDCQKDFTSHFISTLLSTNTGQCYSMPLLYLIMAERMGAEAYLSLAPRHLFIKIQNEDTWYNLELTCRSVLSDYHYMNSSYIKSEAIRNKLYLNPLDKKETIGFLCAQLGKYYLLKYGYDPFVLKCAQQCEKYSPNIIDSKTIKADYETRLTLEIAYLLNVHNPDELKQVSPDAYQHYEKMLQLYQEIDNKGYENMPPEIYERWLKHVAKLKEKELNNPQPNIRKTVQ